MRIRRRVVVAAGAALLVGAVTVGFSAPAQARLAGLGSSFAGLFESSARGEGLQAPRSEASASGYMGGPAAIPQPAQGRPEQRAGGAQGAWTLAQVADACRQSAQAGRPGTVEISSRLQDANKRVTIDVPCIIHLIDGASVSLANVEMTTQTLNLHDRDTGPRRSVVSIANSKITAVGAESGLLIELNDADDLLNMAATTVTAPRGVVVRVAGQRGDEDRGGSVTLVRSTFLSDGAGTNGIQVLSSAQAGMVRLVETTLDTPGPLTVLAGRCTSVRAGKILNCSADQVGRELGN